MSDCLLRKAVSFTLIGNIAVVQHPILNRRCIKPFDHGSEPLCERIFVTLFISQTGYIENVGWYRLIHFYVECKKSLFIIEALYNYFFETFFWHSANIVSSLLSLFVLHRSSFSLKISQKVSNTLKSCGLRNFLLILLDFKKTFIQIILKNSFIEFHSVSKSIKVKVKNDEIFCGCTATKSNDCSERGLDWKFCYWWIHESIYFTRRTKWPKFFIENSIFIGHINWHLLQRTSCEKIRNQGRSR